jgi:predicted MPP superfamily phosphohydrolase
MEPIVMRFIASLVFSIFIIKIIWILFLILDDVLRVFRWFARDLKDTKTLGFESNSNQSGISRLAFLNYLGLGAAAVFFSTALWGVVKGAHNYIVRRRKLHIQLLPSEFEGLKIVQISDIHCGSFWDRKAVERGIDLINAQKPDLVFFTGDLVNDTATEARGWISAFKKIQAPLGVFSILGNHDYGDYVSWESAEAKQQNFELMLQNHKDLGWNLLLDESQMVERNGKKLGIIGVQNWSEKGKFPKYGDLEKAYAQAAGADIKLLLSHDPSHWRAQVLGYKTDIAVQFSGHTHGMQFGIDTRFYRWSPIKYLYKEWMDLYSEGTQSLYVNRGFGYLGYPGRMGIYPEITVFTLTKKA